MTIQAKTRPGGAGRRTLALRAAAAAFAASLAGCGLVPPNIQEFPGQSADGVKLVQGITQSVLCELRDSVSAVIRDDIQLSKLNRTPRETDWFEQWGVQVSLTLTIEEKSSLGPSISWVRPTGRALTLAGGVNGAATATRVDTMDYFYLVKDLRDRGPCPAVLRRELPKGSLLIQSDLKTKEWLRSHFTAYQTGTITIPASLGTHLEKDALTHKVSFQVVTAGDVTPTLTLVNTTFNPAAPLFSTSRDRTHEMILTFGPVDPSKKQLSQVASQSFFVARINSAVARATSPGGL